MRNLMVFTLVLSLALLGSAGLANAATVWHSTANPGEWATIIQNSATGDTAHGLAIYTYANSGPFGYALGVWTGQGGGMFVEQSGEVGIGTWIPAAKLDVVGDILVGSSVGVPGVSVLGMNTRISVLEAGNLDTRINALEAGNLDTRISALEAGDLEARIAALEAIVLDLPSGLLNQKDRNGSGN